MQPILTITKLAALSAVTALSLALSGCGDTTYYSGSSSTAPALSGSTDAALKKTLDEYMTYVGTPTGVPGAIVAVKMNGYQPWYYATGSAEIDVSNGAQRTAMTTDMPFRVASITKMFLAQAVIELAREGSIDPEKSVEYYLPGALTGKNAANADKIKIKMLLNHTSGLYSYVTSDAALMNGSYPTAALPMTSFVKKLGQGAWTHSAAPQDDVLTFVNTFNPPTSMRVPVFHNVSSVGNPYGTNPYFAPGAGYHYSNTNYYLLGLLIEKVTGRSVHSEIERLITQPLGLADTYLPTAHTFRSAHHVHGYADYFNNESYRTLMEEALLVFHVNQAGSGWINGDGILEDFSVIDPSFAWTTGSMISSAKDLLTFTEFVMKSRVQTGQEVGAWIKSPPINNEVSFQYGRGIARVNDTMFGHGGQFAGYNVAAYWYAPLDIYFVVMTNKYSFLEDDPNMMGQMMVGGANALYKTTAARADMQGDPNTAIINGLLGVLEKEPARAKSLQKAGGAPFRFPDVRRLMN